ncbi:PLP-dependent aminotransferase family protein [Halomonas janggokensis]|uniref:PLP-dependent aminotransferase family protein n=1 Tax=Vreelandella janggokensis TaxID=370767 RepID=A0ABT4IUX1_9GAMM|nr:PLP-dependent aminotransferase family protein [Halomonas janggokensis]MCZ0927245.1 PLP-dependent aminotransferase family protein [Halomonas janggokensis]MCZ0929753.1 PLP-dependent aminotransferase family protein [Halomonas janggokensis]
MNCQTALQQLTQRYAQQPERLSKQVRLEQALRQTINQEWPNQTRLPSHRQLAVALGVARNTLALAVATLVEEGLLITSHGSGTWSCKVATLGTSKHVDVQLSSRAQRVLRWPGASTVQSGAFVPGIPDIAQFPMRKWRQLYASVTVPQNSLLLSYSTGGYGPLKRAIKEFLERWRNIHCDTDQIIITDGTHNGIELCAMALADVGDRVAMESPCYWGARNVFTATGLNIDMVAWHPNLGHVLPGPPNKAKLVYLTGSHHYPLSVHTNPADKQRLCDTLSPTYIIEDDYEFNRNDHANLLFDPRSEHHLLVGSFSKIMFPGLRLGYLVVPRHLAGPMNRLRSELFREGRMLDQAVLAQFMFDGDLDTWCHRIQRDYLGRQQVLHDQLRTLPQVRSVSMPSSAISLCVEFEPGINDVQIAQALLKDHLVVRPLSPVCAKHDPRVGLVMGVGMLSGETLVREAQRLRRSLETLLR